MGEEGDLDLLARWREGDNEAGSALFAKYFRQIFGFFEGKVPDEAEDLTQRTFEACIESRDRFRGDGSFRGYIFGIARFQLLRHLKRRGSRALVDADSQSLCDLGISPSRAFAHQQREDLLRQALANIPVDFQISIELFYWHDLTVPEIASALGVPDGTVKSRLNRARRDLRRALKRLRVSPELIESTLQLLPAAAG